jgi:hypothetical protein
MYENKESAMVNEVVAIGIGSVQGVMVTYIIEFLIGVGAVYLAVLGAVKLWDLLSTSVRAFKLDWDASGAREISILRLWKERLMAAKA